MADIIVHENWSIDIENMIVKYKGNIADDITPLYLAVLVENKEMLEKLLAKNVPLEQETESPIWSAANRTNPTTFDLLVEHGAHLNPIYNYCGQVVTPLLYSIERARYIGSNRLLDAGAFVGCMGHNVYENDDALGVCCRYLRGDFYNRTYKGIIENGKIAQKVLDKIDYVMCYSQLNIYRNIYLLNAVENLYMPDNIDEWIFSMDWDETEVVDILKKNNASNFIISICLKGKEILNKFSVDIHHTLQ